MDGTDMRTKLNFVLAMLIATSCLWTASKVQAAKPQGELLPIEIGQPERIEVFPASIALHGPRDRIQLVVTGIYANGRVQDLTRIAEFTSDNSAVVDLAKSVAQPKGDGKANIHVKAGQWEATAPVEVSKFTEPQPVSFHFETLAALSKQGCNSVLATDHRAAKVVFVCHYGRSIRSWIS